ncbi:hypothetical protein BZG00_15695, partial [Salinivibrio kushneri]
QEILEVENRYWTEMFHHLEELKKNKHFQALILKGYFQDKAVNGVSLLAQDHIVQNGKRSAVMEDLIAVSKLQDFFITVENLGSQAPDEDEE